VDLVANPYFSDFTKKTLTQFGWKDGDPLPATLSDLLLQIKETLPASQRTDVLIDIEMMTPESVAEVKKLLDDAKKYVARRALENEADTKAGGFDESTRALYEKLLQKGTDADAGPQIVDDREEMAAETPPAPVVAQTAPEKPEIAPTAAAAAAAPADPMVILPFCPRCGWDMRQKFEVQPTDRDKEDFLATLLGGTRFKKSYELFGGKIVVTFRGLLADENKLIYRQLVLDQKENKVTTEAEWFVQMMDYRLSCSLEDIKDKKGKVISVVPELSEMPFKQNSDNPLETALVKQLDFVSTTILAQEVTRRLVATHLRQFQRLVEALEAMAIEPSFWNGIE
jgi:hypothetical protein